MNTSVVNVVNNLGFIDIFTSMSLEAVETNDNSKRLVVLVKEIVYN